MVEGAGTRRKWAEGIEDTENFRLTAASLFVDRLSCSDSDKIGVLGRMSAMCRIYAPRAMNVLRVS